MLTRLVLISMPIVGKPERAKDRAVGKPILPIPITQTEILPDFRESLTSCKFNDKIFF